MRRPPALILVLLALAAVVPGNATATSPLRGLDRSLPDATPAVASAATPASASRPARIEGPTALLPEPRLVHVTLDATVTLESLLRQGLDIIDLRGADVAVVLEWPRDRARIAALGARVELIDATPATSAARVAREELIAAGRWRLDATSTRRTPADAEQPGHDPGTAASPPLGFGSMGGHWTLAEIKLHLDELVAGDTHDVVAAKLDTLGLSLQGRPVWALELGKSVVGPDARPRVYLNGLTHPREPLSMEALVAFAERLVSDYGVDPISTYLLDHRRITLVPVVNPDGYALNEATYFASGGFTFGMWRKNLRDNNSSGAFEPAADGVDLNRNFGYRWGFNDVGSSPNSGDETYRGSAPFSEPETQIQRDAVIARGPVSGLSNHTFGDLLLSPWSHTTTPAPHADAFQEWNDLMTAGNAYQSGPSPRVLYEVNGDFNDWAYGDTLSKPRAFTWTPEIGYSQSGNSVEGFWPPSSRIPSLVEENLRVCMMTTALAGTFVQEDGFSVLEGALNASYGAHLSVRARNVGLRPTGSTVWGTLVPITPGVRMLVSTVSYPSMGSRVSADPLAPFEMVVDDSVTPGRLMRFRIDFQDTQGLFSRDTIALPLGTGTVIAFDDASSGLGKWSPGTWGIVAGDPVHPSRYFADSPASTYAAGAANTMLFNAPLDLSDGVHAYAVFDARWELEADFDACHAEASLNGSTYVKVAGLSTTPGSGQDSNTQPLGQPLFAGTRWKWRQDWLDLSPFTGPAGTAVRFRWRLRSDVSLQYDGFNFDSLRFVVYDPAQQPVLVSVGDVDGAADLALDAPSPNPARARTRTSFAVPRAGDVLLEVLDLQGRVVRTLASGRVEAGRYVRSWDLADARGHAAPAGVYFIRLATPERAIVRRLALVR